jgi:hypothetical protein
MAFGPPTTSAAKGWPASELLLCSRSPELVRGHRRVRVARTADGQDDQHKVRYAAENMGTIGSVKCWS